MRLIEKETVEKVVLFSVLLTAFAGMAVQDRRMLPHRHHLVAVLLEDILADLMVVIGSHPELLLLSAHFQA